jgi:hypothetical protein
MRRTLIAAISCSALLIGCSSGGSGGGETSSAGTTGITSGTGTAAGGSSGGSSGGATTTGGTSGGDTWSSWASPDLFQPYCVSCHKPGGEGDPSGGLDFTQFSDVSTNAALIRCGVAVSQDPSWNCGSIGPGGSSIGREQFPIGTGAKPSATDRTRLVAWIDAGLPQ